MAYGPTLAMEIKCLWTGTGLCKEILIGAPDLTIYGKVAMTTVSSL